MQVNYRLVFQGQVPVISHQPVRLCMNRCRTALHSCFFPSSVVLPWWRRKPLPAALLAQLVVLANCGQATNRAGAHRPRSTARQTRLSSRPVSRNTNHALPLCAACSSNAAGRHPAIVVACVHVRARRPGQFCSRARVLAAASPFFSTKKKREKSTSEPRLANAKPGRTRIRIGTVVRPVAIGGPIGHQFRSGHGLSAEAGVHVPRAAPVIPGSDKSGRKIRSRWTAGGGCFPSALSNSFDGVPTSLRLEDEAPSDRWLSVI